MSDVVEIYICKPGQAVKEGLCIHVGDIHDKEDAVDDAERRCTRDPSIGRIAYYRINDNGDFRLFYSHTGPGKEIKKVRRRPATQGRETVRPAGPAKKKPAKKSLWQKLNDFLE